ncbi:MAG: serine/threonine protein phosphatase [Deltaproteobacteria bacterium]|nr:serine/threonine protein phosphatase [Nannocystaceae bacterium]
MIQLSAEPEVAEQQLEAVLFYLTTCGYIDDEFDLTEKSYVRSLLRRIVTARVDAQGELDPELRFEQIERLHEHYVEMFQSIDYEVRSHMSEVVAEGEDSRHFVLTKLKLRCFELFRSLSPGNRAALLELVDEFIGADGVVHPAEVEFRNDLASLLGQPSIPEPELPAQEKVEIARPVELPSATTDHPFFQGFEHHYSSDPELIRAQVEVDLSVLDQAQAKWAEQRAAGAGRLGSAERVQDLAGPEFLDEYVYAVPRDAAGADFELIVLGDLHGCYSCLKAAVMQSQFMEKVKAHRANPTKVPDVRLVLLGDYIDRGRFALNGVLRAVLKLFLTVPEHVFVLRGNHEYYIEHNGRIYGGVKPSDTISSLQPLLPDEVFHRYLTFFEQMPTALLFDNLMFVHGGIPRDALQRERWQGLATLNDPEVRFQMLWSDPSRADHVPDELQAASARFAFGRQQFRAFMARVGCSLLTRGHEKVNAGFRDHYPSDDLRLLTVFSAGGVANEDLPQDSNYRDVRPMALTITRNEGETKVTPWAIDYRAYQDPDRNAFFK